MSATPLLELDRVSMRFRGGGLLGILGVRSDVLALSEVGLVLARGETLGIVGESGSGKTTLGRVAVGLLAPSSGAVLLEGRPMADLLARDFVATRRRLQIVMQNPYSSLTPWLSIDQAFGEALTFHGLARRGADAARRTAELLALVGLDPVHARRYPREFSGGQRQRLAIARALALEPEVLVCDEVTSSLDVSIRAQVVNLLADLRRERDLSYLFITHDLHVARAISDRIVVLFGGHVVEVGPSARVFGQPAHPYTRELLAAQPRLHRRGVRATVTAAEAGIAPTGCPFALRCPDRMPICAEVMPPPTLLATGVSVRCHLYGESAIRGARASAARDHKEDDDAHRERDPAGDDRRAAPARGEHPDRGRPDH